MNDIFEVRGEPNYAAEVRQIGRLEPREGVIPTILKAKSPQFFEFETKLLDDGVEILS